MQTLPGTFSGTFCSLLRSAPAGHTATHMPSLAHKLVSTTI
jgi:hypothetical protein